MANSGNWQKNKNFIIILYNKNKNEICQVKNRVQNSSPKKEKEKGG